MFPTRPTVVSAHVHKKLAREGPTRYATPILILDSYERQNTLLRAPTVRRHRRLRMTQRRVVVPVMRAPRALPSSPMVSIHLPAASAVVYFCGDTVGLAETSERANVPIA